MSRPAFSLTLVALALALPCAQVAAELQGHWHMLTVETAKGKASVESLDVALVIDTGGRYSCTTIEGTGTGKVVVDAKVGAA
jgi:hypothetical protein